MSTIGANINEVERFVCEKVGCKHAVALSAGTAALHLAMKLAGEQVYGKPAVGMGALAGRLVSASDMTFDATVNPIVYEAAFLFLWTRNMTPGIWTRCHWKKHSRCILKSRWL